MSVHEKANILMVDDQPAKLLTYEVMLAELGENLIHANSGAEALELLLKTDIAVVLMDVSMPDIDGFELAEIIRQHPRFQKTAIIFISAVHLTDLDRLRGYQRGAVDYISVPVIPELLRAKVSIFAELHRKTQQLENLNRELRQLSSRLIVTQDEERRRIARDLHDGLGQELAAAKMILDGIVHARSTQSKEQAAGEASEILVRVIQRVRSMSHLLHPPLLDEVGLLSAVRWYLEGFTKRSGIETALDCQPKSFPRLSPQLETAIFRIIQEGLTNVFRHSGATKACVTLLQESEKLMLVIRDDGRGVGEKVVLLRPGSIGVGMGGMRERAREFDGELRVANANPGTLIEITIPFAAPLKAAATSGVENQATVSERETSGVTES
jgi:signal transduction histidine kinase